MRGLSNRQGIQWSFTLEREGKKPSEAAQFLANVAGNIPILIFNNIWQDLKSSIAPLSMNNVVFGFPGAGGGIADNLLRGGFLKMVFLEKPRAGTEHINQLVKECFESAHFKLAG